MDVLFERVPAGVVALLLDRLSHLDARKPKKHDAKADNGDCESGDRSRESLDRS